jgi:hypothetical protein
MVSEYVVCVLIFFTVLSLKYFSFFEEVSEKKSDMYIGFHVKYRILVRF